MKSILILLSFIHLFGVSAPSHEVKFFDKNTFYPAVTQSLKTNKNFSHQVRGGIIPHHLLPSFMIADFFQKLVQQNPKTLIMIGPNHYEKGRYEALTSLYEWKTPFGLVKPNTGIIDKLLAKKLIKVDENVLPNDHAVAGILPFVKYYLPNTKVVPILLSSHFNQQDAEILSDNLANIMDKNTVLITPVDFSHYLVNKKAQEKDALTIEVMKNFDYRQLYSLNNDYLDSPPSIAVLLMTMKKMQAVRTDLLYHTNSGILQKDDYIQTTSYFSIAYY